MRTDLLARRVALEFLGRLADPNVHTYTLFDGLMKRTDLSEMDKMFVRALVLSSLRHRGQIETVLNHLMERPLSKKRQDIHDILCLGIDQILYLKTPVHAAVDTMVELSKEIKRGAFTKLVNGVLRALVRQAETLQIPAEKNWPVWLKKKIEQAYGIEKVRVFADCFLCEPPLDLTVKQNPADWAKKLNGQVLKTGSIRLNEGAKITDLSGFKDGGWWVQNASASVPVQLLSCVKGKKVADLCAAPGGKTAQLACLGADVEAFDISPVRLMRLQENMNRLGFELRTTAVDVLSVTQEQIYDAVLLDAPCSATGTIGRHPEILTRLRPDDIKRLSSLQKQLFNRAVLLTKTGGEIVFSTCSLLPEEGEKIAHWALKKYPFLKRGKIPPHLHEWENSTGDIRIEPVNGMDGFFAAVFVKTA